MLRVAGCHTFTVMSTVNEFSKMEGLNLWALTIMYTVCTKVS